jgi:hypothetical protein
MPILTIEIPVTDAQQTKIVQAVNWAHRDRETETPADLSNQEVLTWLRATMVRVFKQTVKTYLQEERRTNNPDTIIDDIT